MTTHVSVCKANITHDNLYNADIKSEFLVEHCNTDYAPLFMKISECEYFHNKDIMHFNYNQFLDLFLNLECSTPKALDHAISIINNYLKYCNEQGLVSYKLNLSQLFNRQDLHNHISKHKVFNQYIWSLDELLAIANFCVNKQDAITLVLPFFGIRGKELEELRYLQVSDISSANNTITTITGRTIILPTAIMDIIDEAKHEEEYYKRNNTVSPDTRTPVFIINKTNYLIRYAGNRQNAHTVISAQSINKRITKIATLWGKPNITPTSLFYSGLMWSLSQLEKARGGYLTTADFQTYCEKWGLNKDREWDVKDLYTAHKKRLK